MAAATGKWNPLCWMEAIAAANTRLEEERAQEEVERRGISLKVRWPWHVKQPPSAPYCGIVELGRARSTPLHSPPHSWKRAVT